MQILLSAFFVILAIAMLELMLYVAGVLLRRASSKSYLSSTALPLPRKLLVFVLAVVVLGGMEYVRSLLAMFLIDRTGGASAHNPFTVWLAGLGVFSVPILPAFALLSTVFAAIREGAIGACDGCNEWVPPFGGMIYGESWGSEDLTCLHCAVTKRQKALLLYPLTKPNAVIFWLTTGMWR